MSMKIVLFFSDDVNGWSETYYSAATDQVTAYQAGLNLVSIRRLLLASPAAIDYIRVSDVNNLRQSTLTPLGSLGDFNPAYTSKSDAVATAAMMRLYTALPSTRALYLRGNPDDAFDVANPTNPDAQLWLTMFQQLGTYLTGGSVSLKQDSWQVRERPRPIFPPTVGSNVTPIISWVAGTAPSANTAVTLGTVPTFGASMYMLTYRVKNLPQAPGLVEIVGGPLSNTYQVRYRTPSDYQYPGGGFALAFVPQFNTINNFAQLPRWTRRATGRPSDVSRGRRRAIPR